MNFTFRHPPQTRLTPLRMAFHYDVVCPWCYIGKRRLDAAIRKRPEYVIDVVWAPFLLTPQLPRQGVDQKTFLKTRFGNVARADRIFEAAMQVGRSVGIDFDFDAIGTASNSIDAHRLVEYAFKQGMADGAIEALFYAYFINGQDIGERDTLNKIGRNLGLDPDDLDAFLHGKEGVAQVLTSSRLARNHGINVVPTYVIDGRFALSGVQPVEALARAFDSSAVFTTEAFSLPSKSH